MALAWFAPTACPTAAAWSWMTPVGEQFRDSHLPADAPDFHLAEELLQDGLDDANAVGRVGLV